jgi:hypothetical protein
VIVGGDMNFSLGVLEVLGPLGQVDNLIGFFIRKLERVGLLNIEPKKHNST